MPVQKKICMLGAYGVGKTSLVNSYLKGTFSPEYDTTIGVRIDLKPLKTPVGEFNLVIWDIAGEDEFQSTPPSYLIGSAGYILVADATRRATFTKALEIQKYTEERVGRLPFVFVLNKFDLTDDWDIDSFWAAPETVPWSATAMKNWICRSVKAMSQYPTNRIVRRCLLQATETRRENDGKPACASVQHVQGHCRCDRRPDRRRWSATAPRCPCGPRVT